MNRSLLSLACLATAVLGCSANYVAPNEIPGSSCNQVADPSNDIGMNVVVGERPAAMGGDIEPGTYETSDRFIYVPKTSTDTYARASDRYHVFVDGAGKGHIEVADRPEGGDAVVRETWNYTTSGTALTYLKACPANGDTIDFGYTASATEIRFFKPPTGTAGFVFVLKRLGN